MSLQPLSTPVNVIGKEHHEQLSFLMNEKFWAFSQGNFKIKDLNGNILFESSSQTFSKTRTITYPNGQELAQLKQKFFAFRTTFEVFQNGECKGTIQQKCGLGIVVQGEFKTMKGDMVRIYAKRGWGFNNTTIIHLEDKTGPVIAVTERDFNLKDVLGGRQTYLCKVAPNMDIPLIVLILMAVDKIYDQRNKS